MSEPRYDRTLLRLTALWAFAEAGLGGILHLFRTPFTGLFVGGTAIVLIALIAHYAKNPLIELPRALLLVLMIKFGVAPHSPLPAYLAVSFQGLLGAVLFSLPISFRVAAILLGILALVESAAQKLITLTLLFGRTLWEAVDAFLLQLGEWFGVATTGEGAYWLAFGYVCFYALAGAGIGWFAGNFPRLLEQERPDFRQHRPIGSEPFFPGGRRPGWRKWVPLLAILLFVGAFILLNSGRVGAAAWLLVRVVTLLLVWYVLIVPLLRYFLKRFFARKQQRYQFELETILNLFPKIRQLVSMAWRSSRDRTGLPRLRLFLIYSVLLVLEENEEISEQNLQK